MKLYELTAGYLEVHRLLEEGEDFQVALDQISDRFDEKVVSVAKMVRGLEAEVKAYQEEGRRFLDKANGMANNAARLKDYLLAQMVLTGKTKVDGLLKVAVQPSPPACIVDDQTLVPAPFLRVIPEQREVDKKSIIALYKESGEMVPGTHIEERNHIVIR